MSLKVYKVSDYDHIAEEQQFTSVCRLLAGSYGNSHGPCLLIGNFNIEGVELDALIITCGGFRILEFKNWGGKIVARENGPWTSDGLIIAGGARGKSPYKQMQINRSRVAMGMEQLLGVTAPQVSAAVIFAQHAEIDTSQLSASVGKWLTVCDNDNKDVILKGLDGNVMSPTFVNDIPRKLLIEEFESDAPQHTDAENYASETAENFFDELRQAAACHDICDKYKRYGKVLEKFLDERTAHCRLTFAGWFAKMDYLLKENGAPWNITRTANEARVRIHRINRDIIGGSHDKADMQSTSLLDLMYLCRFIAFIDKVSVPADLKALFPKEQPETAAWQPVLTDCMRMIVTKWDDEFIYGHIDGYPEENGSKVNYANAYRTFGTNWTYLKPMLFAGAQLNLVRPHKAADGSILPELIIYEPDYLVNVTTVARCFTQYADSPYVNLIHKIEPPPDNWAIILGNFAGQLLDEEMSGKSCINGGNITADRERYGRSIMKFFRHNALSMLTTKKADWNFHEEAMKQAAHIHRALTDILPHEVGAFNISEGIVEPSFFSEMLGLQGRMDYLQMDFKFMFEQKSGKGAFPFDGFTDPKMTDEHFVQFLLYMLVFRFNFRRQYEKNGYNLNPFLLYSKYENSLLRVGMIPEKAFDAIRIRNGIVWIEMMLTLPDGYHIYDSLSPDIIRKKDVNANLWMNWQKPAIDGVLDPIHKAPELDRAYFYRFMRFISNEHMMSKLGNKTKECSGFASTWHDTPEAKRLAGNIYDGLTMLSPSADGNGDITQVEMVFAGDIDNDMSNFRTGDIVILYPYDKGSEPDATRTMVMRCTIKDITKDNHIILYLRNAQSDARIFEHERGRLWAIEHDFMEASYGASYRGMLSFLTAPASRRDLLMFRRKPQINTRARLRGDYGSFNELSRHVKQADDFFLIIGPPGTGKTSFGMLNTLKEELLEPDTSVLIMSYTNRAVDEMCSKMKEAGIDFIRIGGDHTAAPEYAGNLITNRIASAGKLSDVKDMLVRTRVYVGTTTAVNSHLNLFQLKQFDLAIIDEASQILEPQLMGILCAQHNGSPAVRKFVMIGDHKQLPAVVQQTPDVSRVQDPLLQSICLTDCRFSLFERLLRKYHDDSSVVYMLTKQGRMHPDIAAFPNYAFYNGKLKIVPCPHQEVSLPVSAQSTNGIDRLLETRRIAFISAPLPSDAPSDKVNPVEAEMIAATVVHIYKKEKDNFKPDETVGVIVPYRNQISAVRKLIDASGIDVLHDITIDTVERFQGSQRRYIIYGFTIQKYYQLNFLTGNVFKDIDGTVVDRKLNVAMTRAEEHIIMIGHAPLLENNIIFHKLMEFINSRFGYFDIDKDDYISGHFSVPDYTPEPLNPGKAVFELPDDFSHTFANVVTRPLREASAGGWPDEILGHNAAANLDAIAYGKKNITGEQQLFGDDGLTPHRQTMLYCYYLMRQYYSSFSSILSANSKWMNDMLHSAGNRLLFIDVGCGPATCGLALGNAIGGMQASAEYIGIDISGAMKDTGRSLLKDMFGDKLKSSMTTSLSELSSAWWRQHSKAPSLVVFCFSYFFSNTTARTASKMADVIKTVMDDFPLNKYVIVIQQSANDCGLNSYSVFKQDIAPAVQTVCRKKSATEYMTDGTTHKKIFFYEIMTR